MQPLGFYGNTMIDSRVFPDPHFTEQDISECFVQQGFSSRNGTVLQSKIVLKESQQGIITRKVLEFASSGCFCRTFPHNHLLGLFIYNRYVDV